jgi:uroporphyrinogen-III decarboxylase
MGTSLTPKERMFTSLRGEKPDVLPAAPCYLSLFLDDFMRAYYIEQYRRRLKGRSAYPLDHAEDTHFRAQALYQSYGVFKQPSDWIEVGPGASKSWAARTEIILRDNMPCYRDKISGVCVPMQSIPVPLGDTPISEASSYTRDVWDISASISSREDIEALIPIMSTEDWLARGDFDLPRQVLADYGDQYFISAILDTPFSDAYYLLGFQGLMLIQHDHPELFHHLLQRKLLQTSEVAGAWAETGVHGIFVEEAFTGADLISPGSYDNYVFAYNQPFFQTIRELDLFVVHYVCGDVIPRLDRIAEYDISAVAVEESKKNFRIDIAEVIERIAGRIAVFGNIDAVKFGMHATPDEVTAEVERQARIGVNARGFVISTGSPFPLDTNPRNIDTLVSAAHFWSAP